MGEGSARIAGIVKIDGVAAARDVIVISDDPNGRQVVGEGESAGDGSFDITYSGWAGAVIALALDNYGQAWAAGANLNAGTVIHPTTPNGYVYQVTSAGTTGTAEPDWPTEGSVTDGSVTYQAQPYYRPIASGPLEGEVVTVPDPIYRYWRLFIYTNGGGNFIGLSDIEFRDTIGGSDLSDGGTNSASSEASESQSADQAFDGNLGTRWLTQTYVTTNQWIQCVTPTAIDVIEVAVTSEYFSPSSFAPTDFALEYSDDNGATWIERKRWTGVTWAGTQETQIFNAEPGE